MAHDTLVAGFLEKGLLERPFEHAAPMAEGYFLLPPSGAAQTPASSAFLDWMQEEIPAAAD